MKYPIKAMQDDENVDILEIKKFSQRYQDPNIYCVSERRDAKKEHIELWRSQMKKLEDKPGYRKMYDRLGKD